jgi:hypothetical protein
MKFSDLAPRFVEGCGAGKGLCQGLTANFANETKLRIVAWVVGFGTMAGRFSATADGCADGSWAKIAQSHKLLQDLGASGFQGGEGLRHKPPYEYIHILRKDQDSTHPDKRPLLSRTPPGYDRRTIGE